MIRIIRIIAIVVAFCSINMSHANKIVNELVYQDANSKVFVRDTVIEQQLYVSTNDGDKTLYEFIRYVDIKSVAFYKYSSKYDSGIIKIEFKDEKTPNHMITFDPSHDNSSSLMLEQILRKIRSHSFGLK